VGDGVVRNGGGVVAVGLGLGSDQEIAIVGSVASQSATAQPQTQDSCESDLKRRQLGCDRSPESTRQGVSKAAGERGGSGSGQAPSQAAAQRPSGSAVAKRQTRGGVSGRAGGRQAAQGSTWTKQVRRQSGDDGWVGARRCVGRQRGREGCKAAIECARGECGPR